MGVLFSCAIPLYNARQTLERAARSVLDQELDDLELLLIDDGSTDGSGAVCEALAAADRRVRVLHRTKSGVAAARNAALDAARGEYLTFVDADDVLRPGALAAAAAALDGGGKDLVSYSFCWREGDRVIPAEYPPFSCDQAGFWQHFAGYYQSNQFFSLCNKVYRLALIRSAGLRFDESLRTGEDVAFNFAFFSLARSFAHLGGCRYESWIYPATLTRSATLDNLENSQRVLDQLAAFLQRCGHSELAAPIIEAQRPHDALSFYTLLLDSSKPYAPAQRREGLAKLFQSPVWYPALLRGVRELPGLYGTWLALAARLKSPALACLPLRLRGKM